MDATLLRTTRNTDLFALGTGGQRVARCWDQIAAHLAATLGPDHARLFAEPSFNAADGTIAWYAQGEGSATPIEAMAEPQQSTARERLAALVQEVQAAAARLKQGKREDERLLGELLDLALVVPDAAAVHVVERSDGALQPVLAGWGHHRAGESAAPELLLGVAGVGARRVSGMLIIGPPPVVAARGAWWPWLLAAALLLALLLFLLILLRDPFGWFRAPLAQCVIVPGQVERLQLLREAEARETALRTDIARRTLELGDRRAACPPPPAPVTPPATPPREPPRTEPATPPATPATPPTPPTPPPSRDLQRAEQQGGQAGPLQVVLGWDDVNDLDLAVQCPNGQRISFQQRSACGGELDVDANVGPPFTSQAVENVRFGSQPAPGRYRIFVTNFPRAQQTGPARSPYRVTIRQEGRPDRVLTGTVGRGETVEVGQVDVPAR
jgi:hypothetical protein